MNQLLTRINLVVRSVFYLCFVSLFIASASAERRIGNSDGFDHLIPVDGIMDPAYEQLLVKRLFLGAPDLLRIIAITPSARGESGIAIRDAIDGSGNIFVTWTQAKRNLWSATVDTNRKIARSPAIGVNRLEARLPKLTALGVIESMKRVLQRTGPPGKTENVILDGTFFEITVSAQAKGGPTRGLLNDNAYGKDVTALRKLIQLLEVYCHAKHSRHPELLKKLQTTAAGI
jgi:hypothetical protein